MRTAHKLMLATAGATLALGTLGACSGASEETRTCEQWLSELAPEQQDYALNVCDADTGTLDPLTDEQITADEFRDRQDELADAFRDTLTEAPEDEPGMRPCEEWAEDDGREPMHVCMESDLWPDTPMTEAEYIQFAEVAECWDFITANPLDESERTADCTDLIDNPPTLSDMRGN